MIGYHALQEIYRNFGRVSPVNRIFFPIKIGPILKIKLRRIITTIQLFRLARYIYSLPNRIIKIINLSKILIIIK